MKVLRSKAIGRIAKRCVIAFILAVNLLVVAGGLDVLAEMDDKGFELGVTSIELELGEVETFNLKHSISVGFESVRKDIAWKSSDESIAVCDGTVEARSAGTCTITAYLMSKPEVTATCTVRVYDAVTSVTLNRSEVELARSGSVQLEATVSPSTARQDIIWRSSNPNIASVDENGGVKALGDGECQIFAFSNNYRQAAICNIQIKEGNILTPSIQDGYIVKPTYDGDLLWSIDTAGCLEVSGDGDIDEDFDYPQWLEYNNYIKSAKLSAEGMSSTAYWLSDCRYLTEVDLSGLDTSNVTNISDMFRGCSALRSIEGLKDLNTSNVVDMDGMFADCISIRELDLSGLDTDNIEYMGDVFYGCSSLVKLNLSGWIIKGSILDNCYSLTELVLSNCKFYVYSEDFLGANETASVQDYIGHDRKNMSAFCPVKKLDLSGAQFKQYDELSFQNNIWLESVDLSNAIIPSLDSMEEMFYNCYRLENINLEGFDTSEVGLMDSVFQGCKSLQSINLNSLDTSNVADMSYMFAGCSKLRKLDLSNFDSGYMYDTRSMFADCVNLESIKLGSFIFDDGGYWASMESMFAGCRSLRQIDLSNFRINQSKIDLYNIFEGCTGLETLSLPACSYFVGKYSNSEEEYFEYYDVFVLPQADGYFWKDNNGYKCICAGEGGQFTKVKCEKPEMVLYGGVNGRSYWTVDGNGVMEINGVGDIIFGSYANSGNVYVSECYSDIPDVSKDVKKVVMSIYGLKYMDYFFCDMKALEEVDFGNTDTSRVKNMSHMFAGCSALKSIKLDKISTGNVTDMSFMFCDCASLESVDISGFNTAKVTNMSAMFYGCSALKSIKLDQINTSNVRDMRSMFANCVSLESIDISGFQTQNVRNMSWIFSGCSKLKVVDMSRLDLRNLEATVATLLNLFDDCGAEKVILPDLLPDYSKLLLLPYKSGDSEYYWKKEKSGQAAWSLKITSDDTRTQYYADEGGTYIRVKDTPPDAGTKSTPGGTANTTSSSPTAKGTILSASSVTAKNGSIPKDATFTVTSTDSKNPTVSFDGVKSATAKAVTIPGTILYNGVEYAVTTVSPKTFQNKKENAKYKVIDNRIGHLEIAYTGSTDQTKKSVSVPQYSTYKGIKFKVTNVSSKAFKNNKKVTTVKLASSITDIGVSAFEGCSKLKTVTIGKSAKTIGKNAFKNCKNLKTVTIKSSKLTKVGKSAFKGINGKCKIKVPSKKLKAYKALFKKAGLAKSVKVTK